MVLGKTVWYTQPGNLRTVLLKGTLQSCGRVWGNRHRTIKCTEDSNNGDTPEAEGTRAGLSQNPESVAVWRVTPERDYSL
jgi:hypothetical protein